MSSSSGFTQYSINISIGDTSDSGGSLNFYAADGYTDEMVAEIYQALVSLTWPLTVRPGGNISVSKSDQSSTIYTTGYTTDPVTFS
jgi:hypothetical protein